MTAALQVRNLVSGYGKKQVLHQVNLEVKPQEIVVLVGHNGGGKSTTMHSLFGLLPAWSGEIELYGERVERHSTSQIVKRGMALTPQGHGVFPNLTVEDNLILAAYSIRDHKWIQARKGDIYQLFPILLERRTQRAGTMSGGQQQMLAIGMAMMTNPKLLMLDEPSIGLAPVIVETVMHSIKQISEQFGTAVLLVEQNVNQALKVADRVYAMKMGEIVAEENAANLTSESLWKLF